MTPPQLDRHWAIFALDDRWFAVPVGAVLRVAPRVAVTPLVDAAPAFEGVVQFGGHSLAVIDLRQRLGLPPTPPKLTDRLMILQIDGKRAAIHISRLSGLVELDAQAARSDLGHALTIQAQAGGLIEPLDGTVLELDLLSLVSSEMWIAWSHACLGGHRAPRRD
jgi:chemotaxis signal transduction protein